MANMLGDYANFARPLGARDKKPRKRRDGLVRDARTIVDKGIYGAGAGFVVPALVPRNIKAVDRALGSRHMKKIPLVGKSLMNQAREARGLALNKNLGAQTAGGLLLGAAGLAYGANKVRQRRRAERSMAVNRRFQSRNRRLSST